jgi:hypothetical protein
MPEWIDHLMRQGLSGVNFHPVIDFFDHFVNTTGVLVDQDLVVSSAHLLKQVVEVIHELGLRNQLDPLDQNMNEPPLEQWLVPFRLPDHVQHEANIIPVLLRRFVVFLIFTEHANNRKKCIFLQFVV